jgi:hypothetical protein
MHPERIKKQLEFMEKTQNCVICGSNIFLFETTCNGNEKIVDKMTNHPEIIEWEQYKKSEEKSVWFMNHSTLCFNKSAFNDVGKYNKNIKDGTEHFDMELRFLKRFGRVYNIKEPLLYYHHKNSQEEHQKIQKLQKLIKQIIDE